MKRLVMNKKEAERVFTDFVKAPRNKKARLWDTVVPYANKYPELYKKITVRKLEKTEEKESGKKRT